jgi:transposase
VECRLHEHPRHPACRWSAEKGGSQPHEPPDHALGLSRGGFGSKLHVLTDGKGNLLQAILTRGNRNECPVLGPLLGSACRLHRRRPNRLAGDKGYSSDAIREGLVRCGIQPVIPMRENEHVKDRDRWGVFDKKAYKKRNVVERCIAKLKEFRRIATRYEKLAESFIGMINVAAIALYLRQLL